MRSVEELRAEARRHRETVTNVTDPALKQELAACALELSIEADAIERSSEAPEIIRMNIDRYRSMMAAGISDEQQKRIVEELLREAELALRQLTPNS